MRRLASVLVFLISVTPAAWAGMPAGSPGSPSPRQSMRPVTLYVDAAAGVDDAQCGATPRKACRTIQAAVDLLPPRAEADQTIRIAGGDYQGGILLAGRETSRNARIRLIGERGLTRIAAGGDEPTGISVVRSASVTLENLDVEGFASEGVLVMMSTGVEIRGMSFRFNRDGVFAGESDTLVSDSLIQESRRHGISCEGGWLVLGSGPAGAGMIFMDNAESGLRVNTCHASFESGALVAGSRVGLLALNAGTINLNLRTDVTVHAAPGLTALSADCHGMIEGFANSCIGSCSCVITRCGLCESGMTQTSGGRRRPQRMDEGR